MFTARAWSYSHDAIASADLTTTGRFLGGIGVACFTGVVAVVLTVVLALVALGAGLGLLLGLGFGGSSTAGAAAMLF